MNLKSNSIAQFSIFLGTGLVFAFFLHTYILEVKGLPKYGNLIIKSYVLNGILATSIYIGLYLAREKLKNQIGFLFMGGSFLKFVFFFIIFYPVYNADNTMDKMEFSAFFVPYTIALILETVFMAKTLNKMEYK